MVRRLYSFIVNKVSGNGRAFKIWRRVETLLQEKKLNYLVRFTKTAKHATLLAKELASRGDIKAIVAVGGDGTIHEVINGLAGSNIPLGVIPAGSGNDFCRNLEIPLRCERALERILKHERKKIDIGRINDRYFGTVAGIGFDGKVADMINRSSYKKLFNFVRLGGVSYIAGVMNVLWTYKPIDVQLTIDQMPYHLTNVWMIAVANSRFYAGGMNICPEADYHDGLFDICVVQHLTKMELIRMFPTVFSGRHIHHPSVNMFRGKEMEVLTESPLMIHGDGETIGQTPAKLTVEPDFLYVV